MGIYIGTKGEGIRYNQVIGWIFFLLAVLGFIPEINTLLLNMLNINTKTTIVHLVIGVFSLGVYYMDKKH